MPVMLPSAELMAQWAAEQLWDWRVRALFAAVCAIAVILVLIIYLVWGRKKTQGDTGRARRYMGRVSVALFVIASMEVMFFKEAVSAVLLIGTAIVVALIALALPQDTGTAGSAEGEGASPEDPQGELS